MEVLADGPGGGQQQPNHCILCGYNLKSIGGGLGHIKTVFIPEANINNKPHKNTKHKNTSSTGICIANTRKTEKSLKC